MYPLKTIEGFQMIIPGITRPGRPLIWSQFM